MNEKILIFDFLTNFIVLTDKDYKNPLIDKFWRQLHNNSRFEVQKLVLLIFSTVNP